MRETPRRSLARLALLASALVAMGACTPQLDPRNRPAPCVDGQLMCDATGYCMTPRANGTLDPGLCAPGYAVRQGATIYLPVPVARLEEVTKTETASDLRVEPAIQQNDGSIVVPVSATHGLPSGDGDFGPNRRIVTIETHTDGQTVTRHVLVVVSHITASPTGDDVNNVGTTSSPYSTFKQALSVAASGDTIELVDFTKVPDDPTVIPCSAPPSSSISIPDGVTVVGRDMTATKLAMNVVLYGDAILDSIQLTGARLVIQKPGSTVALRSVNAKCGVTVTGAASVDPNSKAPPTALSITGSGSQIWNDLVFESPLEVDAVGALVTIEDNAEVLITTTSMSPSATSTVDTVKFDGGSQTLTILNGAHIGSANGNTAVRLVRSTNVYMEGAFLDGPLLVLDPQSNVEITNSHFQTSSGSGAIQFGGKSMTVTGSDFTGDGIVQNSPDSVVMVDGMTARRFQTFAYKLTKGTATIGNSNFSHFGGPLVSNNGPWALLVDAAAGSKSTITASTTKFDVDTPLAPCEIMGPKDFPGVFSITDQVTIAFH